MKVKAIEEAGRGSTVRAYSMPGSLDLQSDDRVISSRLQLKQCVGCGSC